MMASERVIRRRSHGLMRMLRKPSITICPARVPVSVEDCPEQSSATANMMPARLVPSSGTSSRWACWISVTTIPRLKKTAAASTRMAMFTSMRAVQRHHRIDQVEAAGGELGLLRMADLARLHQGGMEIQIVGHHGGADDPDGHVQAIPVKARHKTGKDLVANGLAHKISTKKQPAMRVMRASTKASMARMPKL